MSNARKVHFPEEEGLLGVWGRDDPYQRSWLYYFDLADGDHLELPNPDDLAMGALCEEEFYLSQRAIVESNRDRFVEVPMLSHQEHHEIFADFVSTLPEEVQTLHRPSIHRPDIGPGGHVFSIGGFLREAEELSGDGVNVRELWREYRRDGLGRRASEWYGSHGFEL